MLHILYTLHAFVCRHSKTYLTNCVLGSSKYKRTFNLAVQNINGPYFKEIYGNSKRRLKAYSYTRKEHWTWSTNMAAMTSKFDFECVIQYYTDQWLWHNPSHNRI